MKCIIQIPIRKNNTSNMKINKAIIFFAVILILTACATTAKFPISTVTPAAVMQVKVKQDKNKNYIIEITAENLASADRLTPSENNYVVWIVTDDKGIKNIGQLIAENGKKSFFTTNTPFRAREIFITAEGQGDASYPSGVEISRTPISLNK